MTLLISRATTESKIGLGADLGQNIPFVNLSVVDVDEVIRTSKVNTCLARMRIMRHCQHFGQASLRLRRRVLRCGYVSTVCRRIYTFKNSFSLTGWR